LRQLRELLAEFGILRRKDRNAFAFPGLNPWHLRKEALDQKLEADEWACVLTHMAGHRAYLSNAKRAKNEKEDEKKKLLKALADNEREFESARAQGSARTIGEWLAAKKRQRNKRGDYRYSIRREWIEQEAVLLFERQRELGNPFTSPSLRERYLSIAFEQGEIKPPDVGPCTFEPDEPRAAKHSYSFELFRLLQRLNDVRIVSPTTNLPRCLSGDEIRQVVAEFGKQIRITYKTLRRLLKLDDKDMFARVNDDDQEATDIVTRSKSGQCAPGTRALRTVIIDKLGEQAWRSLVAQPDTLDGIAAAIAHNDDLKLIREALARLGLDTAMIDLIAQESDGGELGFFKGTGHLSIKALRKLIPPMLTGLDYHRAQCAVNYAPSMDRYSRRPGIVGEGPEAVGRWLSSNQIEALIPNQVVSRAVREVFKQVLDLWRHDGPFDAIHLEMARDVGKSASARKDIENENNRRRKDRDTLRSAFIENFHKQPSDREFERWRLWCEQQGKCPFTPFDQSNIPCQAVLDGDERVQVEHILPRSRFNLDSWDNKVLCLTGANQNKGTQTPYEWLSKGQGKLSWEQFRDQAKVMFKNNKRKLDNLLIMDASKLEASLSSRALNDTRWIGLHPV
jgi:CRISPR-associated endonuclease Csn1